MLGVVASRDLVDLLVGHLGPEEVAVARDRAPQGADQRVPYGSFRVAAMEHWALLVHLVGAFLFVGGLTVAAVCFEAARRRTEPAEVALLLGLSRWGVVLVGIGGVVVLAGGLWLAGVVHA